MTVAEVLNAYYKHAEQNCQSPEGKKTSEFREYRLVIRTVREMYAHTAVSEFGPLALKAARSDWVQAGRARSEANRRAALIRRIFKWAAGEEMVPFEVYQRLTTVTGLQKGKNAAPETAPIQPVEDSFVNATLPYLNPHVRGLIHFIRLTGCRPGEACRLRRCDIDQSGREWLFLPKHHKNTHRGKERIIVIGPRAQELLSSFPTVRDEDFIFSPRETVEAIRAERSAKRETPRYPSHMKEMRQKGKSIQQNEWVIVT